MRSARARGDDERKGFGNIVSAHRLLGRVIALDDFVLQAMCEEGGSLLRMRTAVSLLRAAHELN